MKRSFAVMIVLAGAAALIPAPAHAVDILVNGNFESMPVGTGWTQVSNPTYPPITNETPGLPPQSGVYVAWMGGITDDTNMIYQDVAVPVGTTQLTFSGYAWVTTQELGVIVYDTCTLQLLTTANGPLETLRTWTNANTNTSWTAFSIPASGTYAGTTIRVRIRAINDASYVTNFLFDTCALEATVPVGVSPSSPAFSQLRPAGPNPTRAGSHWRLDLAASSSVSAGIYDMSGRLVHRLAEQSFPAGSHDLGWDGTDADGRFVASGVYLCVASADGHRFQQRIAVIR